MSEPTTEAGKALLAAFAGYVRAIHLPAIEAEAREQGAREERERLRAALLGLRIYPSAEWGRQFYDAGNIAALLAEPES